jgi:phenylpyruvate tautomerase PptA (4-oxalocrotonate tautomerase family)
MPLVNISVKQGWTTEEKKGLLDAVHAALVESFEIPETDRHQRIGEVPGEDFEIPSGKTDRFTLVEISVFPGRSLDAKRRLYASIVEKAGQLGIDPTDVFIVLYEPPMENWGIRGGIPASEVDLGFKVDV